MHRTIGYLSRRVAHIRPGEERKVLLTFLYFFLLITAYYVIKPASRSLVLGEMGSRRVPYADLVCAICMGPMVTLFARLVDRLSKPALVSVSFWAVIGLLLLFWKLLAWWPVPWVAGAFYVWVAIVSVLAVTLFWLVANDIYHPREAKRLFGFIGAGGILGGMVGSSVAAVGAQVIGTTNLVLLSSGLLVLAWWVVQQLWGNAPERYASDGETLAAGRRDTFLSDLRSFLRVLTSLRYFWLLIVMVAANKIVATLISYQLNGFIEQTFPSPDARTTFVGLFFGVMNGVAFVVQCFLTSWILRRWGVLASLLVLPVGVVVGAAGLLLWPVFWLAAVTELYDGSLNYSLQQTAKEVLYLPIDRSMRYKVKPFIDIVVFRFGKGIAAVLGILLLHGFGMPPRCLSYLLIPLLVGWIIVSVWLRRDYVLLIRTTVEARAAARRLPAGASAPADATVPSDTSSLEPLLAAQAWPVADVNALLAEAGAYQPPATLAAMPKTPSRIRQQISQEVEHYQRILHVTATYRRHQGPKSTRPDPVIALLRVLLEESVERVFRFLASLYRPDEIRLVYEQMREHDTHLRADAVELLDTLIDPQMRRVIVPLLDEEAP